MASYHGGKTRIGENIADIIYKTSIEISDKENFRIEGYTEPFCGMLGVYRHIPELFKYHENKLKYKAGDINKSVIMMWKEAQKEWNPKININEKKYYDLKFDKDSALKGFIGHQCSFGGVFFASFRHERCNKQTLEKVIDKINDIGEELKDVSFSNGPYTKFSNLKNHIIYCDPPYQQFNRYYDGDYNRISFDHKEFYDWCRKMSENNIVFVSEFKAPKDFKLISKNKINVNHNNTNKKNIDNLYIVY